MKNQKGFTLVELFVTILIVGVLAAIALPAYQNTIRKTNRSEAKTWLNDSAQLLQRCFTAYGKFNDSTNCEIYKNLSGSGTSVISKDRGFYKITVDTSTATATYYSLTATAIAAPQTLDTADCQTMILDSKGGKGTAAQAACW